MKFKIQYQEKRSAGCSWLDCAPEDEFSFGLKDAALRKLRALRSIPAFKNFNRFRLVEVTSTDLKNKKLIEELPDFYVLGGGSVYLLQPNTDAARDWIREHISDEAQTLGESVAVEHRYIGDIIEGIRDDGLTIENPKLFGHPAVAGGAR